MTTGIPAGFSLGGITGGLTGILDPITKPFVDFKNNIADKAERAAAEKKINKATGE